MKATTVGLPPDWEVRAVRRHIDVGSTRVITGRAAQRLLDKQEKRAAKKGRATLARQPKLNGRSR